MESLDPSKNRQADCGIIVVGPMGSGKSTFLTSLIGDATVFRTAGSAKSCTKEGKAYMDDTKAEQMREERMDGIDSHRRGCTVAVNQEMWKAMLAGTAEGYCLRAKIDMNSPNMNLRDPAMYRIRHAHHHRTGDQWCIYPTYDWTHGQSDSLEGITHSICTLEFENHRPLYDWYVDRLQIFHPQQIEMAKLKLTVAMTWRG